MRHRIWHLAAAGVNGRVRVGGLSFPLVTPLLLFNHDLLAMSGGLEDDIYDGRLASLAGGAKSLTQRQTSTATARM